MSSSDIERFSISAIDEFEDAVIHLLDMLVVANDSYKKETRGTICLQNAKSLNYLKNKSIDLVITLPPYGDSKTTVAYGEFSKLSLQWIFPIGYINVSMEENHDFGYGLRKEFWHKGIAAEAGKAVVEQVKKDGLPYITATHIETIQEAAMLCKRQA